MLYKEDWEKAKKRMAAFWNRQVLDRPCIQIEVPPKKIPEIKKPADVALQWTDIEYRLESAEAQMKATFFAGESFPFFDTQMAANFMSAYAGANLEFHEETVWTIPFLEDYAQLAISPFNPGNPWWLKLKALTEAAVAHGKGKFLVAPTDLTAGGTGISLIRGSERFCLDLIERPGEVKRALADFTRLWLDVFSLQGRLISQGGIEGTTCWLYAWSPGRYHALQDDIICMVSSPMFREFFLPEIAAMARWLDHSLFHLDGPGAVQHLDDLLAIPELTGIQWSPGDGAKPTLEWVPMLQKIQAAGKCLWVWCEARNLEKLLSYLKPEGLMVRVPAHRECVSVEEANALLRMATRKCK
ncbi:MAG: hypothetical protein NT011_05870 [Kiritimatiellaeota bacterium]|nr:hypothetical protein [Kiritimatiellota bacterium]